MYHVGDKVVYPMHGAGIIEAIEKKLILGKIVEYYILKFPVGAMKVMVPVSSVDNVGLREVICLHEYSNVLQILSGAETQMPENWNRRYRINLDKIKSGDIYQVADVVRNLILRDKERSLSTGERKMLNNARQILISELVLATDYKEDEVYKTIDEIYSKSV